MLNLLGILYYKIFTNFSIVGFYSSMLLFTSGGTFTRNLTRNQLKNGILRQVEPGFSSFFARSFGIFDDFLMFCSAVGMLACSTLEKNQIYQKFGEKM